MEPVAGSARLVLKLIAALALALAALAAAPALAHENHQRAAAEAEAATPGALKEAIEEGEEALEAQLDADRPWPQRLMSLLGRTHPFAVHFPIALFPVAWIALILLRRRGEPTALLRALVIVAGASAVAAAALGWLDSGFAFADRDPIQTWHRWIGTALALLGGAVAVWAWRRPAAVDRRPMLWSLGGITALLLVQGWLGAALVHGIEHVSW